MNNIAQNLDQIQSNAGYGLSFDTGNVAQIVTDLLPYLFGAAGILLIFKLITGGFGIMFSRGDPKALQTSQVSMTNAILGVVVLFASFLIVNLVLNFFGLDTFIGTLFK